MSASDYFLCDICDGKCFYDATLSWEICASEDEFVRDRGMKLDYCGDISAICRDCAKTHEIVIQPRTGQEVKP